MGVKTTFLLKKFNTILLTFRSAILGRGKLVQMTSGNFPRWRTTHSFPGPLHFSRWRSSQISHPGTVVDVKIPTHVRFTKSNSRGLPGPPTLGQTIDRCIMRKRRVAKYEALLALLDTFQELHLEW